MTLRIYSTDLSFYDGYIDKLAQEATAGFEPAVRRLHTHVPRLADIDPDKIPSARPDRQDAGWVYAREHGFDTWPAFVDYVEAVACGDVTDLFPEFIVAVERDDVERVERCLDAEPDLINHVASTAKSALHSSGSAVMAAMLIARGAPVELSSPLPGGTPLMHWLVWGQADVAEAIAGASLTPANLRVAAGLGRMDLLQQLLQPDGTLAPEAGSQRDYYRPNYGWFAWTPGSTPQEVLDEALIYAATNNRLEAAKYLLDSGARVDGRGYETTALIRATWKGHTDMVTWLLEQGASVNATGWLGGHVQGGTALHVAANSGHVDVARVLLESGADTGLRDDLYGGRPDGWAQHHGQAAVLELLRTWKA